ncbi:unnamed protein product [Clonostachys rosea]|uniref:DUF6604 domain-containing protein n=1 Tax=Bionectria ochroleuca TaxID=29856 RepID=A0ABY6TVS3_BIOOC|nr:unnamed protein product [Clonostachys rosea]
MLPSTLVSVYQQYKADTDAVAGWLAHTAKAANYPGQLVPPAATSTGRLKGKARTLAKEQAVKPKKAVLPINLFVPLAKYITSLKAPRVLVPQSVISLTERIILQRSAFSSRLSYHGANPTVEGDQSHSYFVDILRQVVHLFRQNVAQSPAPSVGSVHFGKLENRFASLHVQEPSQAFLNASNVKKSTSENSIVFEAEPQTDLDDAIAVYGMLLLDLNKIRGEVRQIWLRFSQGSIEITAAALATNTGVDLAKYLIDQVLPIFQLHGGVDEVAEAFALWFIQERGLNNSDRTPEEVYGHIDYTMLFVNDFMKKISGCQGCTHAHREHWKPAHKAIRELLDSVKCKLAVDKALVTELLSILKALGWAAKEYLKVDEIMSGLAEMERPKGAPFYVNFALQLTLDIHHTLGPWGLEQPAKQLDKELTFMIELIDQLYQEKARTNDSAGATCGCLRNFQMEMKAFHADPTIEACKELFTHVDYNGKLPEQRHRSMQLSPVLCGLTIFYFRASMYDWGFIQFNGSRTIRKAVHLYNALVNEGLIENPWCDMQLAENFFGRSNIFAGQKPTGTRGYLKQLLVASGMTIRGMKEVFGALDGHSTSCEDSNIRGFRLGCKNVKMGAPVSAIFIEQYHNRTKRIDYRPEDVDKIISRRRGGDAAPSPNNSGQHSPHLLLQPFAEALTEESPEVAFPRLLMHVVCSGFLSNVRNECLEALETEFGKDLAAQETVFLIFSSLVRDERFGKELLSKAARIVNNTVASGSGKRLVDVMEKELGLSKEQLEEICSKSKLAEDF